MNRFFRSGGYRQFLLIMLYLAVAAASFSGFYAKWRLGDGNTAYGIERVLDGTAARPYVYRQLIPSLANAIQAMLPAATVEKVSRRLADPRSLDSRSGLAMHYAGSAALNPAVALRYYIVYYLSFLTLFASMFMMRALCLRVDAGKVAATAAPPVFALLLPFFFTQGGFYYDFGEILLMMGLLLVATAPSPGTAGRLAMLVALAALGTWNKESFFFFVMTLYPLLRRHYNRPAAVVMVGFLVFVCGCVYLALRARYAGNPGTTVDYQLLTNLRFYPWPGNWFKLESTYGIQLPAGFSIVMVLVLWGIAVTGWHSLERQVRQHIQIAAVINIPLLLLFCMEGEMRDLSLLYPGLICLLAMALRVWLGGATAPSLQSR
jgi:hypothetical protein